MKAQMDYRLSRRRHRQSIFTRRKCRRCAQRRLPDAGAPTPHDSRHEGARKRGHQAGYVRYADFISPALFADAKMGARCRHGHMSEPADRAH